MKNNEIVNLYNQLTAKEVITTPRGEKEVSIFWNENAPEFQWLLQKNIDKLEREVKTLRKTIAAMKPARLEELQEEIETIVKKAVYEAKKVNPEITDAEIFKIDVDTCKAWEKYEEWTGQRKAYETKVTEFLEIENDFEIHQIRYEVIKTMNLNYQQAEALKLLVSQ